MLRIIRKWAADYLTDIQNKPYTMQALNFEFVDSKGIRYYSFASLEKMPLNRLLMLENFTMFHDSKISPESITAICDKIDEINFKLAAEKDQKLKTRLHAQISALTNELKERPGYITPKSTYYNLAAAVTIREDEEPNQFNERIHNEKYATFVKESDNGNAFFLKCSLLKKLIGSLAGTEDHWTNLSSAWERDLQRESQRLKIILSSQSSSESQPATGS
jgi:hypothetical protein